LVSGLVLDFVILFLGCRWLLSTSLFAGLGQSKIQHELWTFYAQTSAPSLAPSGDMGDLILNAVALEFLLVLNSLVLQA
jgi:hypothetical protein